MDAAPNPILCLQTRSGLTENTFRGVVCVARVRPDWSSEIVHSVGNVEQVFYPRSAMKFTQVLPLLESGAADHYGFTEQEIAIMCASHNAEPRHLATVRSILQKIDLDESSLQCGSHTPGDLYSAFVYCQEAGTVLFPFEAAILNNCSGKHAGMLALCKFLQLSLHDYLAPSHPIQVMIQETAADIFDMPRADMHIGVDGCCAPALAMPVRNAAIAFSRLAKPEYCPTPKRALAIIRMTAAINAHPEMVHGNWGFDSLFMSLYRGQAIAKRGAAGCELIGLKRSGLGFCVKLDSGADEPKFNVAMAFVLWAGARPTLETEAGAGVEAMAGTGTGSEADVGSESNVASPPLELQRFFVSPIVNCQGHLVGHTTVSPGLFYSPHHSALSE